MSNVSSQILTKDSTFFYLDTYINNCLSQIDTCEKGFSIVFNLSIVFKNVSNLLDLSLSNAGRTVLASSGGDSYYYSGGFYLHQVNIRGDNYLELGVRTINKLLTTNVK